MMGKALRLCDNLRRTALRGTYNRIINDSLSIHNRLPPIQVNIVAATYDQCDYNRLTDGPVMSFLFSILTGSLINIRSIRN